MKAFFRILLAVSFSLLAFATSVKAQSTSFPGAEPLVCKEGDTMNKPCAVTKLDPALLAIDGAGSLKVGVVEDTRCPRFARCREPGRIVLKFSVVEANDSETLPVEIEFKRNQNNALQVELSDGSVVNIELLAITHKVSNLPPELFEVKIGYTVDSM